MQAISSLKDTLQGIKFPASKEQILQYAKEHNVPDNVMGMLEKVPDKVYTSIEEVIEKAGGSLAGQFGR